MIGPKIQPTPLHDCATLMRNAAYCFGPRTVVYGLAMVSRNVSPVAIAQTRARYAMKAVVGETPPVCTMPLMLVAGRNHKPPRATTSRPAIMPRLYPSLVASQPAGNDMRKYPR